MLNCRNKVKEYFASIGEPYYRLKSISKRVKRRVPVEPNASNDESAKPMTNEAEGQRKSLRPERRRQE